MSTHVRCGLSRILQHALSVEARFVELYAGPCLIDRRDQVRTKREMTGDSPAPYFARSVTSSSRDPLTRCDARHRSHWTSIDVPSTFVVSFAPSSRLPDGEPPRSSIRIVGSPRYDDDLHVLPLEPCALNLVRTTKSVGRESTMPTTQEPSAFPRRSAAEDTVLLR